MGMLTGDFYSEQLRMTTQIRVIVPYTSNDVTPLFDGEPKILYLLHGLSGSSGEWVRFSKIEYYAKKYNLLVIMPEAQRSFYTDTAAGIHYFRYVADELPLICAKWFRMDTSRKNTFIAGESMGGYGAVKIALNRPRQYAAVASLSGVLDYEGMLQKVKSGEWPEMSPAELYALHGAAGLPEDWEIPVKLVKKLAADAERPRLIQLCGTEDFLYEGNQLFRAAAKEAGYGHTYRESAGDHEWPYWDKAIQYAIQFFLEMDPEKTPLY